MPNAISLHRPSEYRRPESLEREERILRKRAEGMTLVRIAEEENISAGRVSQIIDKATTNVRAPHVAKLREEQGFQLNELLKVYLTKALKGDHKSADTCKWIFDAQRKLFGLEPPRSMIQINTGPAPWDRVLDIVGVVVGEVDDEQE
jgi:hypothetical protein